MKMGLPGGPPPDFLSHSHGEGFLRFFEERCQRQGIFIFDEPESALSPARQIEFLKLLRRMEDSRICQVIMATHAPMLMAYPNATLLRLTKGGLEPATLWETEHFKVLREFCDDPAGFVDAALRTSSGHGTWGERDAVRPSKSPPRASIPSKTTLPCPQRAAVVQRPTTHLRIRHEGDEEDGAGRVCGAGGGDDGLDGRLGARADPAEGAGIHRDQRAAGKGPGR